MTIRNIGPSSTYPSIAAAMNVAGAGDAFVLEAGYGGETAEVTVQDLSINGGASSSNIHLNLGAGISDVTLLGLARIDVRDNAANNTITGNNAANRVTVTSGADVVHGGGGVDRLVVNYAGSTASVIGTVSGVSDGGIHSVIFDGVENFTIRTGAGNDTITTADGDNLIRTAGGNDTITTEDGQSKINSGDGNDTITTGDGGNKVNGGVGDNTITTGLGKDAVSTGVTGDDTILTQGGADTLLVMGGTDTADLGEGADRLTVDYSQSTSRVNGNLTSGTFATGYDGLIADIATNSITFQNVESFDVTTGSAGDNVSTGDGGDRLSGLGGNDTLKAGGGADLVIGGRGADVLTGGAGADTFAFDLVADSSPGARDLITDLQQADTIDLKSIDADTTQNGNQAFTMVGAFTGDAGQATFRYDAGSNRTLLSLDVDGDGTADAVIAATGNQTAFDNFVL